MFSSNPKKGYSIRVHDESDKNVIVLSVKFYYFAVYILYLSFISIVPYGAYIIIEKISGGYKIGTSNLECKNVKNGTICTIIDYQKGTSNDN